MRVAVLMVRHDFCGPFGVELFVPPDRAEEFRRFLIDRYRAIPVGDEAVKVHRIEAGITWPGREITDEYLPAETRQLERAVNYRKGCYLGQEVVERMRSRGVVARQLVGLRVEPGTEAPPIGVGGRLRHEGTKAADHSTIDNRHSTIFDPDGKSVGQVTSSCHSLALNAPIALAYVRTTHSTPGTRLAIACKGESTIPATVVSLPSTAEH